MNTTHTVARNIALKKAGLGFVVDHRRSAVPTALSSRNYESPVLQLKVKHGRTEPGGCKISRRR